MKKVVIKIIERFWPELAAGYHLPMLAIVKAIADPPAGGQECTFERPHYAVDVQLLKSDLTEDSEMPLIRDVPITFPAAAGNRGFVGFPQPGTIVELAFAFGMQDKPFIRSVLPYALQLPAIDDKAQRWQQTPESYQEIDAQNNWRRVTDQNIEDRAEINITIDAGKNIDVSAEVKITRRAGVSIEEYAGLTWNRETLGVTSERSGVEHEIIAPLIWIGNDASNLLRLCSDHMAKLIATLEAVAEHTHPHPYGETGAPSQADAFGEIKDSTEEVKLLLDAFTK